MPGLKILSCATGIAIAAGGFAQTGPNYAAASVMEAFNELRQSPALALRLESTETLLGRTVRTVGTARWINAVENGHDVLRAEFVLWQDGQLVQRVVSDGRTVWNFDPRRNRYSALPVDRQSGNQATTYRANVEAALGEAVGGPGADLVRLAREIAGGGSATHRSWIPGVTPVPGDKPWQSRWAIYDLPTGQPKSVVFELSEAGGIAQFDRFHRTGSTKVGREWRTVDTVITLESVPLLEATSPEFVFLPPRNAVSVPARAVRF